MPVLLVLFIRSTALPRSHRQVSRSVEPPVVFGRLRLFFACLTLPAWHWHPPWLQEPICQSQLVGGSAILHDLCMGSLGWREQRLLSAKCRHAVCVALCASWWLWNTSKIFILKRSSDNVPRVMADHSTWGCKRRAVFLVCVVVTDMSLGALWTQTYPRCFLLETDSLSNSVWKSLSLLFL